MFHEESLQNLEKRIAALEVKLQNPRIMIFSESGEYPQYETENAAGFDLKYFSPDGVSIVLAPMERKLIPTGVYVYLNDDGNKYELQVRPRSGLAIREGFTVLNAPGTIDADYVGEIKVIAINLGDEPIIIEPGERCAQGVISAQVRAEWSPLGSKDDLPSTKRGDGAFGHTGKS